MGARSMTPPLASVAPSVSRGAVFVVVVLVLVVLLVLVFSDFL
jgi:hypothetical protein